MSIIIRRAQKNDTDKVLDLLLQVEGVHQKGRPDLFREHGVKFTAPELHEIFADDTRPVFVAEVDGRVAGYVFCIITETKDSTMLFDMKTVHLEDVCIDETCRGEGIGGALMERFLLKSESLLCDTLFLEVRADNAPAISLYRRYGFFDCGVRKKYYKNPECDALLMKKEKTL
jgi:ribosomal-protein-alanine acetyltransferase